MKDPKLTLPCVHRNGTGKADLLEGYLNARNAVCSASEAIRRVEFNPRDYYPLGDEAWTAARNERATMLASLDRAERDLEALLIHISDS